MHALFAALISLAVAVVGWERRGPHFTVDLIRQLELSNSTGGSIDCWIHSPEAAAIRWLDGSLNEVVTLPGIRHVMPNGTMKFSPFSGDLWREDVHQAEYRCAASTSFGAVLSSALVVQAVIAAPYNVHVMDVQAYPGSTAILQCTVPSSGRGVIEVTHWMAGSRLIDAHTSPGVDSKYVFVRGDLLVTTIDSQDAQVNYRCYTRNRITYLQAASPAGRLVINQSTESRAPLLLQETLTSVSARIEEDVVLTCSVQAIPQPTYRWYRIQRASNETLLSDHRRFVSGPWIVMRQISTDDAGQYRCQASNNHGTVEAYIQLNVFGPFRVSLQPEQQIVRTGQPVELTCNISGSYSSAAVVTWKHNAAPITTSSKFVNPHPHVLRITAAAHQDSGVYQCFVFVNNEIEVQASAELIIQDDPSRFTSLFNEQTVYPGRPVYLHCFATGIPSPVIAWQLDGVLMPFSSGRVTVWSANTNNNLVTSYVNISSAEVQDGGLYCCSRTGEKHCARLNVYGPAMTRWTPNVTAALGDDVRLNCPYSGYPVSSIAWLRNGRILKDGDKHRISSNGTLRVSSVDQSLDAGEYSCLIRGSGSSTAERTIHVEIIRPPVIENFRFPANVQEGGRAQVTCSITSGDLPIEITWMKDGRPLPVQPSVESQTGEFHSILIFKKLDGEHSGTYTCQAKNKAAVASHTAVLLVRIPPQWVMEPYDQALLEGNSMKLLCVAFGIPAPSIAWYRMEGDIQVPLQSIGRTIVSKDGTLRINGVQKTDTGRYLCQASNSFGNTLNRFIRVRVNVPPRVRISRQKVLLPSGSTAVLECTVTGDGPFSVFWRTSDRILENQGRHSIVSTKSDRGLSLSLTLAKVSTEDGGVYTCEAVSKYGSDGAQTQIIIEELPRAPDNLRLGVKTSRSLEIQWTCSDSSDNNLPTGYLVQLVKQDSLQSINHTVEPSRNFAMISNLTPFTSYRVHVYAINHVGLSLPSNPLDVQTLEEAPTGVPRYPTAEARGPRSVSVSWLPPAEESWNGKLVTYAVQYQDRKKKGKTGKRSIPAMLPDNSYKGERYEAQLDDLLPATVYDITIRAINRFGSGPESATIVVSTPEAAPSAAPLDVRCNTLSAYAVHLTWSPPAAHQSNGMIQGYKAVYSFGTQISPGLDLIRDESKRIGNVLSSTVYGLQPFRNYTFKVAAFTRAGMGPFSSTVSCQTEEDVPKIPEYVKVIGTSGQSALVSWLPPSAPNGVILRYTIKMKDIDLQKYHNFVGDESTSLRYEIRNLTENRRYEFSVYASTKHGDGLPSPLQIFTSTSKIPARILEFSRHVLSTSNSNVILPCTVLGPKITEHRWSYGGESIESLAGYLHYSVTKDGTLIITNAKEQYNGEYLCSVQNIYGRDSIVYTVEVLRAPHPPVLSIGMTTVSSITVTWSREAETNLQVIEFIVHYRKSGDTWYRRVVDGSEESVTVEGLDCGTQYELQIQARNPVGVSQRSEILRALTRGTGLSVPDSESFFSEVSNSPSSLIVHLDHWPAGGCRVRAVQIEKRHNVENADQEWNTLAGNINPDEQPMFVVHDLLASQTYQLRLTAYSNAGSKTVLFNVVRNKRTDGRYFYIETVSLSNAKLSSDNVIIIVCMSVSSIMLVSSVAAVTYVIYKRGTIPRKTNTEYSMNTMSDRTGEDRRRSRQLASADSRSTYSLRKSIQPSTSEYEDDEDITPYATFTLKPICNVDTTHSLMSVPSLRPPDSHSSNSIEVDLYGRQPTLPSYSQQANRHLNRSPVPPYRYSDTNDSAYSDGVSVKHSYSSRKKEKTSFTRSSVNCEVLRPPPNFSDSQEREAFTRVNKF